MIFVSEFADESLENYDRNQTYLEIVLKSSETISREALSTNLLLISILSYLSCNTLIFYSFWLTQDAMVKTNNMYTQEIW